MSTIHKAKGKEFDNIDSLITKWCTETDEAKRTPLRCDNRAKTNSSIHYNGNYLIQCQAKMSYIKTTKSSPSPQQIAMYLIHRDVQLEYFHYVQHRMRDLIAGVHFCHGRRIGKFKPGITGGILQKIQEVLQTG